MLDVRTVAATVVVAAAGLAVAPGPALGDRMCRGSLGAVTVDDNVFADKT